MTAGGGNRPPGPELIRSTLALGNGRTDMESLSARRLLTGYNVAGLLLSALFAAQACFAQQSRAYGDFVPSGSLRLGQVTAVAKRDEILKLKPLYEAVQTTGIADADIVDGRIVAARVYCCGGGTQEASSLFLFVPKGIEPALSDIVEYRVGRAPAGRNAGVMNTVTRIVQKAGPDESTCWWAPKNDRVYERVLYCEWMPGEGWTHQGGFAPAWFKPSHAEPSAK
jgi:hypothetical protein